MKIRSLVFLMSALLLSLLSFQVPLSEGVLIGKRTEISYGLPQNGNSFTTVETFDSDGDGKDEIYMGGSGFESNDLTEGIRAFEYDTASGRWEEFGSGLPSEGSHLHYGALGLGDLNGDGEMDIAAPVPTRWFRFEEEPLEPGVDIYTGDGRGNFQLIHHLSLTDPLGTPDHDSSNEAEIIDIDGDGHSDIILSTYVGIRVFFGDGSGTNWEESSPTHVKQTEISGVGIGDVDNDGLLDLVGTPYQRSSEVEMYIQGNRRSWRDVQFQETDAAFGVKIIDVDLDDNNDIVFGTLNEGIKVFLGQGETTITGFPSTPASSGLPTSNNNWNQVELRDINGDDYPDLVAACSSLDTVNVYLNEMPTGWSEAFTGSDELIVGGDPYGANFGDWNGDGQVDVAGCGWDSGANAWLIDSGGGTGGNLLPIADAGDDMAVNIGETVVLDGRDSDDPDGDIVQWDWDCTSHPSLVLADDDTDRPSFVPDEEGLFIFTLRVLDDENDWSSISSVRITVLDPDINYPPTAIISGDPQGVVGDTIYLDGSNSMDVDGDIVGWEWTCTSHSISIQGSKMSSASFVADEEGEYSIELVVEDDDGDVSVPDTINVHIESDITFVYPQLGPFEYDNGDPVVGALITLQGSGNTYSKETDKKGNVRFSDGVLPGTYSGAIEIDGENAAEFSIEVKQSGTVTVDGGSYPVISSGDGGSDEMTTYLIIGGSIGGLLLVVVVLYFIVRGSGGKNEQVQVAQTTVVQCPKCGSQTRWIPDFQRNYCDRCSEYL